MKLLVFHLRKLFICFRNGSKLTDGCKDIGSPKTGFAVEDIEPCMPFQFHLASTNQRTIRLYCCRCSLALQFYKICCWRWKRNPTSRVSIRELPPTLSRPYYFGIFLKKSSEYNNQRLFLYFMVVKTGGLTPSSNWEMKETSKSTTCPPFNCPTTNPRHLDCNSKSISSSYIVH